MKWFRFYDEVLDDPKCQRLSPVLFRHWVNVLCIANRSNTRGTLPEIESVAFSLRLSPAKARRVLADLVDAELLDCNEDGTYAPHNWSGRQRVSDDVAQRVAKHRERTVTETESKHESNVTSNVTETVPHARVTEAETETDTPLTPQGEPDGDPERDEKPPSPMDLRWQRFWASYPRKIGTGAAERAFRKLRPSEELTDRMIAALEAVKRSDQWTREHGRFIPHASTWINQRRWDDDPDLTSPIPQLPQGVELRPGEVPVEVAPGHWELRGADGRKRIIRPEFYGVIFDEREHLYDGLPKFHESVREARGRAASQEQIA